MTFYPLLYSYNASFTSVFEHLTWSTYPRIFYGQTVPSISSLSPNFSLPFIQNRGNIEEIDLTSYERTRSNLSETVAVRFLILESTMTHASDVKWFIINIRREKRMAQRVWQVFLFDATGTGNNNRWQHTPTPTHFIYFNTSYPIYCFITSRQQNKILSPSPSSSSSSTNSSINKSWDCFNRTFRYFISLLKIMLLGEWRFFARVLELIFFVNAFILCTSLGNTRIRAVHISNSKECTANRCQRLLFMPLPVKRRRF